MKKRKIPGPDVVHDASRRGYSLAKGTCKSL